MSGSGFAPSPLIFAERLPGLASHYARRTERLDGWFTHVSFAVGGEAGTRLLKDLGVLVSADTLLNHIRSSQLRAAECRGIECGRVRFKEQELSGEPLPDASAGISAGHASDILVKSL
jgi:hypothetical protein